MGARRVRVVCNRIGDHLQRFVALAVDDEQTRLQKTGRHVLRISRQHLFDAAVGLGAVAVQRLEGGQPDVRFRKGVL